MSSKKKQDEMFENYMNMNDMFYPCNCIMDKIQDYYFDNIHDTMSLTRPVKHNGARNIIGAYFKLCVVNFRGIISLCDIMITLEQSSILPCNYLEQRFNISHPDALVILTYIYQVESKGDTNHLLCPQKLNGYLSDVSQCKLKFNFLMEHQGITSYLRPLVSKRLESKKYNTFIPKLYFFHMEKIWKNYEDIDMEQIFDDFKIIEYLDLCPQKIINLFDDCDSDNIQSSEILTFLIKQIYQHFDNDIMINIYEAADTFDINLMNDHSINDCSLNDYNDDFSFSLMNKIIKLKNKDHISLSKNDGKTKYINIKDRMQTI